MSHMQLLDVISCRKNVNIASLCLKCQFKQGLNQNYYP